MAYFSISRKHGATNWSNVGIWTTTPYIANIACLAVVLLAAIVFHLVYYKQYKNFKKRTFLTAGLAAMAATFVTNGFFAPDYTVKNLWLGLSFAALYYGFYLLIFHTTQWKKGYSMRYLAFGLFMMGVVIAAELGVLYLTLPELRATGEKDLVKLGWGISNSIAFIFLLTIPFGFYLTYQEKHSLPYFLGTTAMLIAVIFTYARATLIVAVPLYVAGSIFACLFARRRLGLWIAVGLIFAAGVAVVALRYERLLQLLNFYIQTGLNDRGRFELWIISLKAFLTSPLFGVGLYYHYGVDLASFFWAHNTVLQFLATGGLLGLVAYLFHRAQTVYMFVKKPTVARLFAGLAVLCLIANSMLDVAMSCQNIILYYGIILAFAEKDYLFSTGVIDENGQPIVVETAVPPRDASQKARVLFPLVEAGVNYSVPLKRVAEAFKTKYGDRVDITVLPFFGGDAPAPLHEFEQEIARTADLQRKMPGYRNMTALASKLFKTNLLQATVQSTVPGSYPLALERMAKLDPDMVFSTHWSTAYYAARCGVPCNVQYCADLYLDALWNTGADLLTPSQTVVAAAGEHTATKVPLILDAPLPTAAAPASELPTVRVDGACGHKAYQVVAALLQADRPLRIVVASAKDGLRAKLEKLGAPESVRHRGIEPHKPHTADFTASCALTSSDVDPATTDSVRAQSTANCAACGASSFGESNPSGRETKPRKSVAGSTHDEAWPVSRSDLPPKPYGFVSSMPRLEILSEWDDGAKYMPSVDLTIGAADSLALVYGVPAILLCCKSPAEQAFARYCVDELKCAKQETDPQKAAELALQLLRTDTCAHMQAQARSVAAARGAETIADILFEQLTARFTTAPDGAVTRAYK